MLNRLKEKEEKINQTITSLAEESARGIPIIVEGKKDVETLRQLGIAGQVICAKTGGRSILDVISEIEKANTPEVILFLDFDRRGKQVTNRIRHNLERARVRVRLEFWRSILSSCGKDLQCVEGLKSYLENLRLKIGE